MTRRFEDARRWMQAGTTLLVDTARTLDEAALREPSLLPGWTRRVLVAHVAANADALRNLVRWAATGEETPMYASPEARARGIEVGGRLPTAELLAWLRSSADRLETDMAALHDEQWSVEVVTAQGRAVPAAETPWLRDREVLVHLVDLRAGVGFADLPDDFLRALKDDALRRRSAAGEQLPRVSGTLADVTAYLTGRPYAGVTHADGTPAPALGPWL